MIEGLTTQWSEVGNLKDREVLAELRSGAALGHLEYRMEGGRLYARLPGPKEETPAPVAVKSGPPPEWVLDFGPLREWKPEDSSYGVQGHFDRLPAGHRFAWSCLWYVIENDKLRSLKPAAPETLDKLTLYVFLQDLAARRSPPLYCGSGPGVRSASDLVAGIVDARGRWPDLTHGAMIAYLGQVRDLLPCYPTPSCLIASGNRWVFHPAFMGRRIFPGAPVSWRPGWSPPPPLQRAIEFPLVRDARLLREDEKAVVEVWNG